MSDNPIPACPERVDRQNHAKRCASWFDKLVMNRLRGPALSIASLFFLALTIPPIAPAAPTDNDRAETPHVQAQLVASVDAVYPGEEIILGVHQKIIPHWHTYWRNPGDSGTAPTIAWDLPAGASAGDIDWPTPGRFKFGPVVNYGYAEEVTLLTPIAVPADARPGGRFAVGATVDWLVCREECIPQQVRLRLSLPIAAPGQPRGAGSPLIAAGQARLPMPLPGLARAEGDKKRLLLHLAGPELRAAEVEDVWFYPVAWGAIEQSAAQVRQVGADGLTLSLTPGEAPLTAGADLEGVLVVKKRAGEASEIRGYALKTPLVAPAGANGGDVSGLPAALLMALLGGIILNLMPCVFPVLSIKALAILKHAHETPWQTRLQGIAYTAGILASFAVLAALLLAAKAAGAEVGWGFQFQSPAFVLAVAYLMFAVGLNLSGVFSFGHSLAGLGSALADRSGYAGSFFTGALAAVVATPCTAPLMGAALGYAIAQPPAVLVAVCLSLGLGLALPFMLLSLSPALRLFLPKPGAWMENFKQFLAFPMYASAVWLVWVLAQQTNADTVLVALGGMVLIALAAWLYDRTRRQRAWIRHGAAALAGLAALLVAVGGVRSVEPAPAQTAAAKTEQIWEAYSPARLQALRDEGRPVFLNFTAAWCITCLVNERVVLSTEVVKNGFKQSRVVYLKGDWTNRDRDIGDKLAEFARSGVPLYVVYPAGDGAPRVLPQILTPETVLEALAEAAAQPSPTR